MDLDVLEANLCEKSLKPPEFFERGAKNFECFEAELKSLHELTAFRDAVIVRAREEVYIIQLKITPRAEITRHTELLTVEVVTGVSKLKRTNLKHLWRNVLQSLILPFIILL